jgi:ribonuclease D
MLHAGDNDLAHLKRRHRFAFASIFDTSLAARFLGIRTLGLDVLLARYLEIELPPSRQKDDWSVRPLSDAQERYAIADVVHLIPLKHRLADELLRAGRLAWVEEECAALAAEPPVERPPDAEAFLRLRGARELPPRELGILRELQAERERLARAHDRPPFKILGDQTLVELARARPTDRAALAAVAGCTPPVVGRWGGAILAAVERGLALPEAELPAVGPPPRRPVVPPAVTRRIEALRTWRTTAAERLDLEPGALLPNRLIRAIAEAAPRDRAQLAAIEGLRRWRVDVLGDELLAVLGRPR